MTKQFPYLFTSFLFCVIVVGSFCGRPARGQQAVIETRADVPTNIPVTITNIRVDGDTGHLTRINFRLENAETKSPVIAIVLVWHVYVKGSSKAPYRFQEVLDNWLSGTSLLPKQVSMDTNVTSDVPVTQVVGSIAYVELANGEILGPRAEVFKTTFERTRREEMDIYKKFLAVYEEKGKHALLSALHTENATGSRASSEARHRLLSVYKNSGLPGLLAELKRNVPQPSP